MRNVLADLALESEAATATALRLARAYDEGDGTFRRFAHRGPEVLDLQARDPARRRGARVPGRQRLRRGVPDAAAAARLAAERHLGGLGQRHRLDVLRAIAREPEGLPAFLAECELARGATPGSTSTSTRCRARSASLAGEDAQWLARRAVEDLALAFQALAAGAHGAARRGRRLLRRAARRGARPRLRHAAGGCQRGRDPGPRPRRVIT